MTEHRSLIYSNRFIYQFVIRLLYGRNFKDRYQALAELIPSKSSVVDLCCGDCFIYSHYLKTKQISYLGLDLSTRFINEAQRQGINARHFDVWADPIPRADVIMMQGSLYQFIPNAEQIIRRMLASADLKVIIAEPIINMSSSGNPILSAIGRLTTRPGPGEKTYSGQRFVQQSLADLFVSFDALDTTFLIPGGRELVGVFKKNVDPSGKP